MRFLRKLFPLFAAVALSLAILCGFVLWGASAARVSADPLGPGSGTVVGVATRTLPVSALTGLITQTKTTNVFDPILSTVKFYHSADVFISVVVKSGASMTATVQLSADGQHWADAYYTSVVGSSIVQTKYISSFAAAATVYHRVEIAGEYMRVVVLNSGNVTPTIQLTLRND